MMGGVVAGTQNLVSLGAMCKLTILSSSNLATEHFVNSGELSGLPNIAEINALNTGN
jgi:hypothetical protein